MPSRVDEYRAQLAAVRAEPSFRGKRTLIAFLERIIAEEARSTTNITTSEVARRMRSTQRARVSTRNTRRRNHNGTR